VPQFFTFRGSHHIGDFAYHVLLARGFWFEEHAGIYRFPVQQQMLNELFGAKDANAMPPAVLPTFLVVYYPFAFVALRSISFAYSWWTATWLFLAAGVLWKARLSVRRWQEPAALLVGAIVLGSDVFYRTVVLGQTSVCAVSLFVLVYGVTARPPEKLTRSSTLLVWLLVLVSSMKPPYLVVVSIIIAANRRFGLLAGGFLLTAVTLLALTVKLGAGWPLEYASSLANHLGIAVKEEYRPSLVGPTMNVFRYAFADVLGEAAAYRISLVLFIGGWLALGGRLLRGLQREIPDEEMALSALCWSIALFLLLAPYSGSYEDLLIVAILALIPATYPVPGVVLAAVASGLFLVLNYVPFRDTLGPGSLWLVKASLLITLTRIAGRGLQRDGGGSEFSPSRRTSISAVSSR
jgi:hypothetical protein